LLDAVCARYFEKLDEEMQRMAGQLGEGEQSPIEVLRAQGLAYVRFALTTPELYRIATMGEARPGSDIDVMLNNAAFRHLQRSVETLMAAGVFPAGDSTTVALELWTAAHGVAAMLIARPHLPWGDAEEFADRVLRAVCIGEIVSGAIGPTTGPQEAVEELRGLLNERLRR
jgi:AcrR family transcriptional regulator